MKRVDQAILEHMIQSEAEFIMEVTDKTKADVKVRSMHLLPQELRVHDMKGWYIDRLRRPN